MSEDTSHIDIDYVAELARIRLTEAEKEQFSAQLADVLAYFEKLKAVDVDGIDPMAHPFESVNIWDEDEPGETFTPDDGLRNAPARRDNQIVVPKVVEDA